MDPARAASAAVAAAVGAGASVLAVGALGADLGEALEARGCRVTLLGPPGLAADQTWASRVGTVDEARPDPGSLEAFDAVVAPHLLDHAADPAAALGRTAAAVRPRGLIVLVASGASPAGALHRHDAAQVERLCEAAGLAVQAVTVVSGLAGGPSAQPGASPAGPATASTTVVVARRPATAPSPLDGRGPGPATLTAGVDQRLRDQRARIRALEEEVRALRRVGGRPRLAAVVARVARVGRAVRAVRDRIRTRG